MQPGWGWSTLPTWPCWWGGADRGVHHLAGGHMAARRNRLCLSNGDDTSNEHPDRHHKTDDPAQDRNEAEHAERLARWPYGPPPPPTCQWAAGLPPAYGPSGRVAGRWP